MGLWSTLRNNTTSTFVTFPLERSDHKLYGDDWKFFFFKNGCSWVNLRKLKTLQSDQTNTVSLSGQTRGKSKRCLRFSPAVYNLRCLDSLFLLSSCPEARHGNQRGITRQAGKPTLSWEVRWSCRRSLRGAGMLEWVQRREGEILGYCAIKRIQTLKSEENKRLGKEDGETEKEKLCVCGGGGVLLFLSFKWIMHSVCLS